LIVGIDKPQTGDIFIMNGGDRGPHRCNI
jgi:hypothetical protein